MNIPEPKYSEYFYWMIFGHDMNKIAKPSISKLKDIFSKNKLSMNIKITFRNQEGFDKEKNDETFKLGIRIYSKEFIKRYNDNIDGIDEMFIITDLKEIKDMQYYCDRIYINKKFKQTFDKFMKENNLSLEQKGFRYSVEYI